MRRACCTMGREVIDWLESRARVTRFVPSALSALALTILVLTICVTAASGQASELPVLTADNLRPTVTWAYSPGDNPLWAEPDFNDGSWEMRRDIWFEPGDLPASGWTGIGWFRTRFAVDTSLVSRPLALMVYMRGAAEVYLDGVLIASLGKVADTAAEEISVRNFGPRPRASFLTFSTAGSHVMAIRHSNFAAADQYKIGGAIGGLEVAMEYPQEFADRLNRELRGNVARQFFFTGIPLAFAVLYLILFAFYQHERKYLYFAVLSASVAAMTFIDLGGERILDSRVFHLYRQLLGVTGIVLVIALLRFVYALFYRKLPRQFPYIVAGSLALAVYHWFSPFEAENLRNLAAILLLLEVARTVVVAAWRRLPDAWIIGLGLMFFGTGTLYDVLIDLRWIEPLGSETNGYYYGFVGLIISMALYLARGVARGHALEAEHERQRRELEAARDLQLSMLPRNVPEHPDVELAAHMQTATEVGGDYYDFFVAEDGTLTIAIGDATGHGLHAGTMVTATKSLFSTMAQEHDLDAAVRRSSDVLRRMGMPQLYMALAVARLRDGELEAVGAGMPPALVYRRAAGEIEDIPRKGLPLGAPRSLPHHVERVPLFEGDTVLFMSDGLPELRNDSEELFGPVRVRTAFEETAHRSPAEIVDHLVATCRHWTNGKDPNDDVTLVVMRIRDSTTRD